jgi:hypothetical protein
MPQIVIKSLKVGLWVILSFIFTANSTTEIITDEIPLSEGSYLLNVSGESELQLQGAINFETIVKRSSKGKEYTILKLNLTDQQNLPSHSLGFFVSQQYSSAKIDNGRYKISTNIKGFFNNFDGVFGFANISQYGELPFFTKNGSISINNINEKVVEGSMNVVFENTTKKSIDIKGNFVALRK